MRFAPRVRHAVATRQHRGAGAVAQALSHLGEGALGTILADQIPGVDAGDAEARVAESIRDRRY
jgi:hypothetical protein